METAARRVEEKVLQYEAFVSDVLQRDLRQVLTQREEIYEQLAHYLQLKNIIERLQESADPELHTQVDLGCNFYVSAEVTHSLLLLPPTSATFAHPAPLTQARPLTDLRGIGIWLLFGADAARSAALH
ncbi:protein UXT isoform X2 [Ornithorhynchus anatinus]|uniref:protein UXT isoform X2 n=1 Tax=Ornithorhynchus anatinus TaxID=9258 RepID=UPI0019D44254|nr:protein UXT isoform X2 [Ornithorhynchus anatinus]